MSGPNRAHRTVCFLLFCFHVPPSGRQKQETHDMPQGKERYAHVKPKFKSDLTNGTEKRGRAQSYGTIISGSPSQKKMEATLTESSITLLRTDQIRDGR